MHDAARLTIQAAKERLYDLMTRLEDASADLDREEAGAARVALDAMERPLQELDTLRRSATVLLG